MDRVLFPVRVPSVSILILSEVKSEDETLTGEEIDTNGFNPYSIGSQIRSGIRLDGDGEIF